MLTQKRSLGLWLLSFLLLAFTSHVQAQGYTIVPVARPNDLTLDGDRIFSAFSPSLNDAGQVAFVGRLWGLRLGLYLYESTNKTVTIARGGDPADRCKGAHALFGQPWLNDSGQIAFSGGLNIPRGDGIFFFDGSQIRAVVCPGDPAPGGSTFAQALTPVLNHSGQIAFYARLANREEAVFFYDGAEIRRVAGTGDPAPGGGTFVRALRPSINDEGQVVSEADLSPPGSGIFLYANGELRSIVRDGDPTPEGDTFSSLHRPIINNRGQIAFLAFGSAGGVWVFDEGKLRRILPSFDPETGDEMGVSGPTRGYPHPFHLNGCGQIAFDGGRRHPDEEMFRHGLFFLDGEGFRNIVLQGDPMPGGGTFLDFHSLSANVAGQVAFTAFYPVVDMAGVFLAIPPAELEQPTR